MREHRYEKYTWVELDAASQENRICILPVGAVEQHGPHLPMDVDVVCPTRIALAAGEQMPDKILVLPPVSYGYTGHVMDYPGTINVHYERLIDQCLDICRSLAYHGFKKIILFNGHGSNVPNIDLVARRTSLETDAECVFTSWWNMLQVDPHFLKGWRESKFPGGCAHGCELETSVYWHLCPNEVRVDKIESFFNSMNEQGSRFRWVDLFASGPVKTGNWTSSFAGNGTMGDCEKASPEKGRLAFEEAVKRLCEFGEEWRAQPGPQRHDHHAVGPTMPMPWNQDGGNQFPEHHERTEDLPLLAKNGRKRRHA